MSDEGWKSRLPERSVAGQEKEPASRFQQAGEETNKRQLQPDWRDILALTLAAYQVLALPLLLLVGGIAVVMALLFLLAR